MSQSEAHVIRNNTYEPSTQAGNTIGSGTTMQKNQLAARIAASNGNEVFKKLFVITTSAVHNYFTR